MSKLISKDDFIKLFDNYDITISDSDYSRYLTVIIHALKLMQICFVNGTRK